MLLWAEKQTSNAYCSRFGSAPHALIPSPCLGQILISGSRFAEMHSAGIVFASSTAAHIFREMMKPERPNLVWHCVVNN